MEERDIMFKIGTKVKLRDYLKVGNYYGGMKFEDFCKQDFGKVLTITKVTPCKGYISTTKYEFEETPLEYTVEMLEPITECDFKIGDEVIMNPERSKRPGVLTVTGIIKDNPIFYKLSDINGKPIGDWLAESIIKVPLFKVGQIVQFHNIKEDKWYPGTDDMANLEGKLGMVAEITMNHYVADKPNQDGCRYSVRDLTAGRWWNVTSAAIKPVIEDIRSISKDDTGSRGDLGVVANDSALAIAQAVDSVKGPQFKIGDKVIIRNDLIPGKKYNEWDYSPEDGMGGWEFVAAMAKYMGKVATITGYVSNDPNYCRLDIDGGLYSWIVNAFLLPYIPGSDYDLDKQIINQQTKQNYENQLQGKEEPLIGGCECTGTGVCYPGEQAATCIGHLGYRKITYRS